jgi:hypothetical protein
LLVHGAPAPPLVQVPLAQLRNWHWSFCVQGRPPGAASQEPGTTPAGSTQVRFTQSLSNAHGSCRLPALQMPRPHNRFVSQFARSMQVSPGLPSLHLLAMQNLVWQSATVLQALPPWPSLHTLLTHASGALH